MSDDRIYGYRAWKGPLPLAEDVFSSELLQRYGYRTESYPMVDVAEDAQPKPHLRLVINPEDR
jgi:hypothetical protein